VRDRAGKPIPNAVVSIDGRPATTGPDGRYEIRGLRRGRRSVHALGTGYVPTEFPEVRVRASEVREVPALVLPEHGVRVAIRVLDTDAQPVPDARLEVRFEGVPDTFPMRADAFGRAEIEGPSRHDGVLVTAKAWGVGFAPNAATEGAITERVIDVVLERYAMLFGTLKLSREAPPPRTLLVQYRGHDRERWRAAQALIARGGREFVCDEIPPGDYDVAISATGFAVASAKRHRFRPGRTTNVGVIHLGVGGTISGQVYVGTHRARPGIRVEIRELGRTAHTDADGRFTMENVPAGEWRIEAWPARANAKPGTVEVTVREGGTHRVIVRMGK
jgi:hypothetical protein